MDERGRQPISPGYAAMIKGIIEQETLIEVTLVEGGVRLHSPSGSFEDITLLSSDAYDQWQIDYFGCFYFEGPRNSY